MIKEPRAGQVVPVGYPVPRRARGRTQQGVGNRAYRRVKFARQDDAADRRVPYRRKYGATQSGG